MIGKLAGSLGPSGARGWTRRELFSALVAGTLTGTGLWLVRRLMRPRLHAEAFIGKASRYEQDLGIVVSQGLRELGVTQTDIKGKRILLKPNLVETSAGAPHINTHPLVVRGAAEAFLRLGASAVLVAEGPGHRRDTLEVLEESGLGEVLHEDRIPFVDINYLSGYSVENVGSTTRLRTLTFPDTACTR